MPNENRSAAEADWILWEKLLGFGKRSAGVKDVAAEQAVDSFVSGIVDDPAYQEDATVNGVLTPLAASRKSAMVCGLKCAPGAAIHIGDVVRCLENDWLVVDLFSDKVGIINGTMWMCNDVLAFQNHTHTIIERPCVIDDGSYSRRASDPVAYVPVNTYKLYLPIDAETEKLHIDKRLAIGKSYDKDGDLILEVYKIEGVDKKTRNHEAADHLMVVSLQRDVYNASTDSFQFNICDYIEEGSHEDPETPCAIDGRSTLRIGTTAKYAFVGNTQDYAWNVTAPAGVSWKLLGDGELQVSVSLKPALVGSEITIEAIDDNSVLAEKKVLVITIG